MIFGFGKRSSNSRGRASVPVGSRVFAVGDIHGRDDLLDRLSDQIAADLVGADCDHFLTVFLGDYVDRGPNSAAVIERLSSGSFPTPIVMLRGNHEEMLLHFLEDDVTLETWRLNGGIETLHSYKVNVQRILRGQDYKLAQQEFASELGDRHLQCLKKTQFQFEFGDYFFCHAGIRPGVALDRQRDKDLMWIRDEFLTSAVNFGKIIVHGHTPVPVPDVRANRINIDTGAFATNRLTCLVLQGEERRFIAT
jgi:serine/threonine protein phosphatase 1